MKDVSIASRFIALLALACIIIAALFYANFREVTWLGQSLNWLLLETIRSLHLPWVIHDHLPSLLQALALGSLMYLLAPHGEIKKAPIVITTLTISLACEALQLTSILPGTFDLFDVAGILIATLAIYVLIPKKKIGTGNRVNTLTPKLILISGSLMLSMGCVVETNCSESIYTCVDPVTLDWEEMRADITPTYGDISTLTTPGKLFKKDPYLFVMDKYRGVHIFDHSDPQNPTRQAFIPIIGALDISILNDHIYVNGFTDLVIIDYQSVLDGNFNNTNVSRKQNMFAPPLYSKFLPENYALDWDDEDEDGYAEYYDDYVVNEYASRSSLPSKGIIIGYYNQAGDAILFGEYNSDPYYQEPIENHATEIGGQ